MDLGLENKRVLVTGSTSGIGEVSPNVSPKKAQ